MKAYLHKLSYLWVLLVPPRVVAAETSLIYVMNQGGTMVHVIDAATNKVVQVIRDIEAPEGVRFSIDGSLVFITIGGEDALVVVDRVTVYTPNKNANTVSAIDVKTMKVIANIPVGQSPTRVSTLVLP